MMKDSFNTVENSQRCIRDLFVLILVTKKASTSFAKIKTTYRVAIFLSTLSQLADAVGSQEKLASITVTVFSQTNMRQKVPMHIQEQLSESLFSNKITANLGQCVKIDLSRTPN